MSQRANRNNNKRSKPIFDTISGIVTFGLVVFGAGYAVGAFVDSNDHKMEILRINQECEKRINAEIDKNRENQIQYQNQKMDEIVKAVEVLQKRERKIK